MVSPVFNIIDNISSYFETHNNKIIKVSSAFETNYGFTQKDLENFDIKSFLRLEKNEEKDTTTFSRIKIPTKWGVAKEAFLVKAVIEESREIYILKENYSFDELILLQDSYIDKTTGLQYKHAFNKSLNKDNEFCIAAIKIKNFIRIPSFFGEDFADMLLIELSKRLKDSFNSNNIYLLDNTTFCILNRKKDHIEISSFAKHIKKTIRSFDFADYKIAHVLPIIDYTFAFTEGKGCDIFQKITMALTVLKEKEKSTYILEELEQQETIKLFDSEVNMLAKLRNATKNDKIMPFYQPIYCNKTKKINKYECLARMQDEDGEFLSPYLFIDIAKKYNLEQSITKAIVRHSFENFKGKNIDFSINLSIQSLTDISMYYYLIEAVENYSNPENIIFEIVESEAMPLELFEKNPLIIELRKRKCRFALDDFGSGYSNLSMLTYFNYDYLKIDGSLISSLNIDACYKTISTIVELAHNHNVEVIAEWVKDKETQKFIEDLNIDYSQGFYFGMPLVDILPVD